MAEQPEVCPFCHPHADPEQHLVLENAHCRFLQKSQPVLVGSGVIVPIAHRETLFDLTPAEWEATFTLLQTAKQLLDDTWQPQGYNVGWNCGRTAGQELFHAHLHVIPRFSDEPMAGRGIRYAFKGPENARRS